MKILFLSLCVFLSLSCRHKSNRIRTDKFYTRPYSSWDAVRIPLIRPYALLRLNGNKDWNMNEATIADTICFCNIEEVNVIQQKIVILHSKEPNNDDDSWFIIIPAIKIEKAFKNKEDFEKYLSLCHLGRFNYKIYNVDSVYTVFLKNNKIDWDN